MPVQDILQQTSQIIQANQPDIAGNVSKGFQIGMGLVEAYDRMQKNKELADLKKQELEQKKGDYILGYFEKTMTIKDPGQRKNMWKLFPNVYKTAFGAEPNPAALELFKSLPDEPNGVLPSATEIKEAISNPQKRAELIQSGGLQRFFGTGDIPTTIQALNDFAKPEREIEIADRQFLGKSGLQAAQSKEYRLKAAQEAFRNNPMFKSKLNLEGLFSLARQGNEGALQAIENESRKASEVQLRNKTLDDLVAKGIPETIIKKVDRSDIGSLDKAIAAGSNFLANNKDKDQENKNWEMMNKLRNEVNGVNKEYQDLGRVFKTVGSLEKLTTGDKYNPVATIPLLKAIQQFMDSPRVTDSELYLSAQQAPLWARVKQKVISITDGGTIPKELVPQIIEAVNAIKPAMEESRLSAQRPHWEDAKKMGFEPNRIFQREDIERFEPKKQKEAKASQYENAKSMFQQVTGQKYPGNGVSTKRFKLNGKEYTVLELRNFVEQLKGN